MSNTCIAARPINELSESERANAISAFQSAHSAMVDLGFAPDRAWIEGFAYAKALDAVPALDAQGVANEGKHDGTKSRDGENDTSASQDEGHDASRVGGESGPAAEQHHEHRVGKSGVDREHDQRDCRGAGVHGAFDLPPQVVQTPAFIYNGETYRDLESMLEGYTFGTAFYAEPPLPHAVGKPLSEQQIAVLRFLDGVGDLRGYGFGMKPPEERGNYWWRKDLRAAFPFVDFGIVTKESST